MPTLRLSPCTTLRSGGSRRRAADQAKACLELIKAGLALIEDQVERWRRVGDAREQAMRLPPVMGLVIEDMQERELQLLLDVVRIADGVVADCSVEVGQCKRTDIGAMRASSCSRAARKPAKSSYRISTPI